MRVLLVAHTTLYKDIPDYLSDPGWSHLPKDADELAEQAGRLCYLSWDRPNPKTATNKGYLENIINQGHFSVLEHASATFYIDGVSRNFTHELIRHRHLSFSEVSQRYVDVGEFNMAWHPDLLEDIDEAGMAQEHIVKNLLSARSLYRSLVDALTKSGKKRKEARQAARHVLPSGLETKILVTGNMRAWRDVLYKRLAKDPRTGEYVADKEFVDVAREILQNLKKIAPNTFQDFEED